MAVPNPSFLIPESTAPVFQEYDFSTLDSARHSELIIERLLLYGNRAEVRWLLLSYGRETVCDWLTRIGHLRLSRRRYHLWCFVFHVPMKERPLSAWPY
jgi:hypothetical protein